MSRPSTDRGAADPFIAQLLEHGEPSTRYKLALAGLGGTVRRREIRSSDRVAALLAERGHDGRIDRHPYTKWTGAHWVLVTLAELGYPPGDRSLLPMREQVLDWLLDARRLSRRGTPSEPYLAPILTVAGRIRIHASLEGNARALRTQGDGGGRISRRRTVR